KGQVLVRQLAQRGAASTPAAAPLFDQLRTACGQLAAATLAPPAGEDSATRQRRIQSLSQERERLEARIAQFAPASREKLATSPQNLLSSLPPETVLIDFLEYWRTAQEGIPQRLELTAFVSRPNAPIARLEFGAVDPLAQSIETW